MSVFSFRSGSVVVLLVFAIVTTSACASRQEFVMDMEVYYHAFPVERSRGVCKVNVAIEVPEALAQSSTFHEDTVMGLVVEGRQLRPTSFASDGSGSNCELKGRIIAARTEQHVLFFEPSFSPVSLPLEMCSQLSFDKRVTKIVRIRFSRLPTTGDIPISGVEYLRDAPRTPLFLK